MRGVLWTLGASISFTLMGGMTKAAVAHASVADVVFWRSVAVAAVACAIVYRQGHALRPGNLKLMILRSSVGLVAMGMYFWSISQIEFGLATALLYSSPLFMVLLSGRLLRESTNWKMIAASVVAFSGVLLILRPVDVELEWGALAALGAGFLAALAYTAVRHLRTSDPPARIVAFFSVFSAVGTAPFALYDGVPTDPWAWVFLLGVGAGATGGQLMLTKAFAVERAAVVAPFTNATVLFSYLVGLVFWDEQLSVIAVTGMGLIVLSGAYLARAGRVDASEAHVDPEP